MPRDTGRIHYTYEFGGVDFSRLLLLKAGDRLVQRVAPRIVDLVAAAHNTVALDDGSHPVWIGSGSPPEATPSRLLTKACGFVTDHGGELARASIATGWLAISSTAPPGPASGEDRLSTNLCRRPWSRTGETAAPNLRRRREIRPGLGAFGTRVRHRPVRPVRLAPACRADRL